MYSSQLSSHPTRKTTRARDRERRNERISPSSGRSRENCLIPRAKRRPPLQTKLERAQRRARENDEKYRRKRRLESVRNAFSQARGIDQPRREDVRGGETRRRVIKHASRSERIETAVRFNRENSKGTKRILREFAREFALALRGEIYTSEEGCEREEELDGRTGERCREKKGRGCFFFDRVGIRESIAAEKERR